MHTYSTPMTPPPTTIMDLGISGIFRIWSLLMMVLSLKGTRGETAGFVRGAMTIWFAFNSDCSREPATCMRGGAIKQAIPRRKCRTFRDKRPRVAGDSGLCDFG